MLIHCKPRFVKSHATSLLAFASVALLALPSANAQLPNLFQQPAAGPQSIAFNFSTPIATSGTETPGTWYTDRFAPCLFSSMETAPDGTKNTLEESICASNFQTPAPSFYNTQGRKYDLVANTSSISINLYVPSAWATTQERLAAVWATAANSTGVVGNDYAIIEFQGPTTASSPVGPGEYPNASVAGFYGWDNTANSGNGGFTLIGLPPGFQYNRWVTLTMTTVPGVGYEYTVRDVGSQRGVSIRTAFYDTTETSLSNVILEGYNYNNSYSIFWNNLTFVSSSFTCTAKPQQSSQPGGLLGLLLGGLTLKPATPPPPPGPPAPIKLPWFFF